MSGLTRGSTLATSGVKFRAEVASGGRDRGIATVGRASQSAQNSGSMLNVHLRINDAATSQPTPVRLCVSGPGGTVFAPLGRTLDFPAGCNEDVGGHLRCGRERWYATPGACEVALPSGVPLRVRA